MPIKSVDTVKVMRARCLTVGGGTERKSRINPEELAWRRKTRCEVMVFDTHNTELSTWVCAHHMQTYFPACSTERVQEQ